MSQAKSSKLLPLDELQEYWTNGGKQKSDGKNEFYARNKMRLDSKCVESVSGKAPELPRVLFPPPPPHHHHNHHKECVSRNVAMSKPLNFSFSSKPVIEQKLFITCVIIIFISFLIIIIIISIITTINIMQESHFSQNSSPQARLLNVYKTWRSNHGTSVYPGIHHPLFDHD